MYVCMCVCVYFYVQYSPILLLCSLPQPPSPPLLTYTLTSNSQVCPGQRDNLVVVSKMLMGGYNMQSSSSPTFEVIESPKGERDPDSSLTSPDAKTVPMCMCMCMRAGGYLGWRGGGRGGGMAEYRTFSFSDHRPPLSLSDSHLPTQTPTLQPRCNQLPTPKHQPTPLACADARGILSFVFE